MQVQRPTMARIFLLLVLLVAAAQANESPTEPQESQFRREILTYLNKTDEKLTQLMKMVFEQAVEAQKAAEDQKRELITFSNATNDRFDQLAKAIDHLDQRHNQTQESVKHVEENRKIDREQLDSLANLTDSQIKLLKVSAKCNVARSFTSTLLSTGKKYLFSLPMKKNWASAKEFCTEKSLHLATIRDQNDAQVVAAAGKRIVSNQGWWVSARNQGSGNQTDFQWHDGTQLGSDSPLWTDGDNKAKDCVRIFDWSSGNLNSFECTTDLFFICELPSECY
ncbi:C-type lectin domain family 4 member K-like [Neocloeon triangulifer]|uniref:C-type lectin domain family 4 member K-like n=1 Tax=Neocloeon triangulifer TaxID=2078957 RepID=UPI00286FAB8E|nr:C-type lectin domain family 4 member K-like [Neocloeon triangulifer]